MKRKQGWYEKKKKALLFNGVCGWGWVLYTSKQIREKKDSKGGWRKQV